MDEYLTQFWASTRAHSRRVGSGLEKSSRLAALVAASVVVFGDDENVVNRATFDQVKYGRLDLTRYDKCFACNEPSQLRHHIILLKHGGTNDARNLVSLCTNCHAHIHPWLPRGE